MSRSVRAPRYDVETIREQQARAQEALVIYPKHPDADAYRVRGAYEPYAVVATDKRFADAELAAEYYSQDARCHHEQWIEAVRGDDDYEDWERAMQSRMYEQLTMLHRFATQPHFD
jgi:hypothetical protein